MASMTRAEVAAAIRRTDRTFATVIKHHGPPPSSRAIPVADRFGALAKAILYQQLAGAAAAAIHGRVLAAVGDPITARGLRAAGDETLAGCGVSGPKRKSLFDLADKTTNGTIDLASLGRRSDDEVADELTSVHGIGEWTAHMFCLTALARRDVWPSGDYGVRAGWSLLHGDAELISAKLLRDLGEPFRPHRSAVAWYCWRAVEDERTEGRAG